MIERAKKHFRLMGKSVIAISGVGSIFGVLGAYDYIHTHQYSIWFWLSIWLLILLVAQVKTVQNAITMNDQLDESLKKATGINQTFIHMSEGASLTNSAITDNAMLISLGAKNKRKYKRAKPEKVIGLATRGQQLSDQLYRFAEQRRNAQPSPFASTQTYQQASITHYKHTKGLYEQLFVSQIGNWLEEVMEYGFDVEDELIMLYPRLVGAAPIEETARKIALIAGSLTRSASR